MHAFTDNIKLASVCTIVWTHKQHLSSTSYQICVWFGKAASGHDNASRWKSCWHSQHRFLILNKLTEFSFYTRSSNMQRTKKAQEENVLGKMHLPQPPWESSDVYTQSDSCSLFLSLLSLYVEVCRSNPAFLHLSISLPFPPLSLCPSFYYFKTLPPLLFPSHFKTSPFFCLLLFFPLVSSLLTYVLLSFP